MKKSLKSAILIPFVIVFLTTFVGITSIQIYKFEKRVNTLGEEKMLSITNSIKLKLDNFLEEPLYLGIAIRNLIASNSLNTSHDLSTMQKYLSSTVSDVYHYLPQIQVVGFGNDKSEYVGVRKGENNNHLILKDSRTKGLMTFFSGDTIDSTAVMTVNNYDPKTRPWYVAAAQASSPVWSTIYTSIDVYNKPTLRFLLLFHSRVLLNNPMVFCHSISASNI